MQLDRPPTTQPTVSAPNRTRHVVEAVAHIVLGGIVGLGVMLLGLVAGVFFGSGLETFAAIALLCVFCAAWVGSGLITLSGRPAALWVARACLALFLVVQVLPS